MASSLLCKQEVTSNKTNTQCHVMWIEFSYGWCKLVAWLAVLRCADSCNYLRCIVRVVVLVLMLVGQQVLQGSGVSPARALRLLCDHDGALDAAVEAALSGVLSGAADSGSHIPPRRLHVAIAHALFGNTFGSLAPDDVTADPAINVSVAPCVCGHGEAATIVVRAGAWSSVRTTPTQ